MSIDSINQELSHAKFYQKSELGLNDADTLPPKLKNLSQELGYPSRDEVLSWSKEYIITAAFDYADEQIRHIQTSTNEAHGQLQRATLEKGMTEEHKLAQQNELRKQIIIERVNAVLELQAALEGKVKDGFDNLGDDEINGVLDNLESIGSKAA